MQREANNYLSIVTVLLLSILFSGCSSDIDDLVIPVAKQITSVKNQSCNVSKEEALDIARKVLKKRTSRGGFLDTPTFEYVVKEKPTRSNLSVDTLAYILNFPDNEGFVIVSADRRVYPVLGFSNEGCFSFENDNAKTNFIDNIEYYIEESNSDTLYEVSENDFDGCYVVSPMVQISLSQRSPWDKFVIEEHPNCPVGCVAVATALVMSHSKTQINYHNSNYNLKAMVNAIKSYNEHLSSENTRGAVILPPGQPIITTYEQAVDSIAKLLYWIGKDVKMKYSPDGSAAFSKDAYELCKSLNFSIPSGYALFDIKEITRYLNDNHIVYIRGDEINGRGGHAWVSDACYFCVDINDSTQILDTYIHCDWGWGGSCNGYYSGSVFEASGYIYEPGKYFAVKREW